MRPQCPPMARARLGEALIRMRRALELLDRAAAPGQVGATLDLAIGRLELILVRDDECQARLETLIAEAEREARAVRAIGEAPVL